MVFESIVIVKKPIEVVFARWSEFERFPEWFDSTIERKKLSEGPQGVGTKYRGVEKMPGKRVEFILEITAFKPNQRIAAQLSAPMNAEWDATFETVQSGTRLTLRSVAHLSGIMALMAPLMIGWAKRTQQKGLNRFKASVEGNNS